MHVLPFEMNDPLSIIGLACAIGLIAAWAVMIIKTLSKDKPNDKPWSLDDRDEHEE